MGGPPDRPPPLSTARCMLHGFKLVDPIGPLPRYVAAAIAAVSELVFDEPFSMCRQRRLSRRWPRSSRGHVSEDWTYQTEQTSTPRLLSRWHTHHTHTCTHRGVRPPEITENKTNSCATKDAARGNTHKGLCITSDTTACALICRRPRRHHRPSLQARGSPSHRRLTTMLTSRAMSSATGHADRRNTAALQDPQ